MQLVNAHKGILYKVCRLYQDQEEDRRDLLQEIVLQLWASYGSFRGESQFSSWMYRVALNTAIVYFRKQNRRPDRPAPGGDHPVNGRDHPVPSSHHPVPDADFPDEPAPDAENEQLAVFYRAIQQLTKVEKALIFLYMEGRSGKEMAAILDLSPGNVRVRLNRTKEKLQHIIKNMGYEF